MAAEIDGFTALPGNGLSGTLDGKALLGGSQKFVSSKAAVPDSMQKEAERLYGIFTAANELIDFFKSEMHK